MINRVALKMMGPLERALAGDKPRSEYFSLCGIEWTPTFPNLYT